METHPATGRFLLHPDLQLEKLVMLPSSRGGVVILCPHCWCGYIRPTKRRARAFSKVHLASCAPRPKTVVDESDADPCAFPGCEKPVQSKKNPYCGSHRRQLKSGQELRPLRRYSRHPVRPKLDLQKALALRASGYTWEEMAEELDHDPRLIFLAVREALNSRSKGGSSK